MVNIYKKKSSDPEERKTLRYLITKYAAKRTFTNAKGKEIHKRPRIQRLITPERLRRKKVNEQIKDERRKMNEQLMKIYKEKIRALKRPSKKVTGKK